MTTVLHSRPAPAPSKPISVNGHIISAGAITQEIQYHPASSPSVSWRRAAEALVLRELLRGEIQRNSVEVTPLVDERGRRETTEEAKIRALIEREVCVPIPKEGELRRYYEANQAKFRSPELFEARHILIAARASDAAAFALAREKALALASDQRLPAFPEIPTTAEAGLPGFTLDGWFALFAPAGTPQPIVDKLNAAMRKVGKMEAVVARANQLGVVLKDWAPGQMDSFAKGEGETWGKVIRDNKITFTE